MGQSVELGSRRVLKPGRWRWARALGWMLALFAACLITYTVVTILGLRAAVALTGGVFTKPKDAPESLRLIAAVLSVAALLAVYAAAVRRGEDRLPGELALRTLPWELPAGLAVGAALMTVSIGLLWAGGWVSVTPQPITKVIGAIRGAIESGFFEETLVRLVIFRLLWRAFGVWPALAVSALFFGVSHLANPNATWFAAICIALEAGILLAAFYILTGRAWAAIGVHAGWNFTQGWVFGAAVSGGAGAFAGGPLLTHPVPGVPEILSGGAFGPEASLAALLVCTAAGVATLGIAARKGRLTAAD